MMLGFILILFSATFGTLNRSRIRLETIKTILFYYFQKGLNFFHGLICRFTLPPFLTLKNFEGLDLGKMDKVSDICLINLSFNYPFTSVCSRNGEIILQTDDSGLASYVAGQIDRSLSWKVRCLFFFIFHIF